MSVTVVVCNYNGEEHLPPCLTALRGMRGEVTETIVVDNASTDGSRELVARDFPEVRVLALEENDGPSAARNAGMRAASTPLVLALDNDVVVGEDTLERLLAAREESGAVLLEPRSVLDSEPERVHYDAGELHYCGLIALRNFYRPISEVTAEVTAEVAADAEGPAVVEVGCAVALCLLVDRERVLELGGYDERYFILFEDNDLSYRLRAAGERIASVPGAVVRHRAGTAGISFREGPSYPSRRVFLHARNRWLLLAKNHAAATLLLSAPGLVLYELVSFAFALGSGHPIAWLHGKLAALAQVPGLLAERRRVQRGRRVPDRELLVGGPLTVTPAVAASAAKRGLLRGTNAGLEFAWRIARSLLPRGARS